MPFPPVSIIVLTQDEETNIAACLESVAGCGDVHVVDSGSTDNTVEIARRHGASVHHHPFHSFGDQRNWAIDNIRTVHPWQFHLDADERLTGELISEITSELAKEPGCGGYFVPSKLMLGDRWLRYAGDYPTYQVRLLHRERVRFVDYGHGQREQTTYALGRLEQPYLHHAFSKGLENWFVKHARYARQEAENIVQPGEAGTANRGLGELLFSADPVVRRRAMKSLSYSLPLRYVARLFYMLVCKRAFLDGSAGIAYAQMMAAYEAMIDVFLTVRRANLNL